jgi:hypothetical protein
MQFKYTFLFLFTTLLISSALFSQMQLSDLKKSKLHTVKPVPIEWGGKTLPFKNVVVVDSRFDTSKLGYIKDFRYYEKLHTPDALPETLQQTINTYQRLGDSSSAPSLYIFIKHLWLQQSSYNELSKQKLSNGYLENVGYVACSAVLECYMQKDSFYYPLFRLDTMLTQKGNLRKKADELLTEPFQVALLKSSSINLGKKRKQMTAQEVTAYNSSKKNYPRLQTDILEHGIYLTFQDFLHNRVTKGPFEVQRGLTDELYTVDGKDKKLLLEFWGFCDGQKQYMKVGFNFYELSREQDTYEMIGAKKLIQTPDVAYRPNGSSPVDIIGAGIINMANRGGPQTTLIKPLQLNMETGEPY